jgi:hypothetical protein
MCRANTSEWQHFCRVPASLSVPFLSAHVDRRKGPPGGPFLSHWSAEEEV